MSKINNLKTETIHVRSTLETKNLLKTLSDKLGVSDSSAISLALDLLSEYESRRFKF